MDVLETAQHVVHDGLNVSLSQVEVAPEHLTEVWWCRLKDQVQILEVLGITRLEDVIKLDYISMAFEETQQYDLS